MIQNAMGQQALLAALMAAGLPATASMQILGSQGMTLKPLRKNGTRKIMTAAEFQARKKRRKVALASRKINRAS